MATKRMLSSKIIDSDAFLDMPQTSQLLYFHLAMRVDDDGFVGSPKKVMRMIGSSNNDLDVLFGKKFILGFENGVIVIKHHRINNNWDSHNCKRTQYTEELGQLFIKENGAYTMDKNQGLLVQSEVRLKSDEIKSLEENRIEENRIEENKATDEPLIRLSSSKEIKDKQIAEIIKAFETVDVKNKKYYGNKTQRQACEFLIDNYGFDETIQVIGKLPNSNKVSFYKAYTPNDLVDKWQKVKDDIEMKVTKQTTKPKTISF